MENPEILAELAELRAALQAQRKELAEVHAQLCQQALGFGSGAK